MSATPTRPLPSPLPLFPLQTVLFPGALLGLKIFETRYLDLASELFKSADFEGLRRLLANSDLGRNFPFPFLPSAMERFPTANGKCASSGRSGPNPTH